MRHRSSAKARTVRGSTNSKKKTRPSRLSSTGSSAKKTRTKASGPGPRQINYDVERAKRDVEEIRQRVADERESEWRRGLADAEALRADTDRARTSAKVGSQHRGALDRLLDGTLLDDASGKRAGDGIDTFLAHLRALLDGTLLDGGVDEEWVANFVADVPRKIERFRRRALELTYRGGKREGHVRWHHDVDSVVTAMFTASPATFDQPMKTVAPLVWARLRDEDLDSIDDVVMRVRAADVETDEETADRSQCRHCPSGDHLHVVDLDDKHLHAGDARSFRSVSRKTVTGYLYTLRKHLRSAT